MENSNIVEADSAQSGSGLYTIAAVFCVFLLTVLLLDPAFTRLADHFLDSLLVPIKETGNASFPKNSAGTPAIENTAKSALKTLDLQALDLKNPAIPDTGEACLLTEAPVPDKNLMWKDLFPPDNENLVPAAEPPVLAGTEEGAVWETAAGDSSQESEVPAIDVKVADAVLPEAVPETPLDVPTDLEQNDIIQDSVEEEILREPVLQGTLPEVVQTPNTNIVDSTTSDESDAPFEGTDAIEPDPEIPDTNPSDMETGTDGTDDNAVDTTSCFLLDESGMLSKFLPEYAEISDGCLFLPPECTGIRSGAFSGAGAEITELYIPSKAVMLEAGAFNGLCSLLWIEIDTPNPVYKSINGVLFDSTASILIAFPAGRTDVYSIPSHVTQIAGGAFADASINRLDLRRCPILFFDGNIFGVSDGNGMVIAVPAEDFSAYEEMLNGYAVTLTK